MGTPWDIGLSNSPEFKAAFEYSVRRMGVYELVTAENALYSEVQQLAIASEAAGMDALAAGALPVVLWVYIVRKLVGNYEEAREIVSHEEAASGFSQGFVTGLLGWQWYNVRSLLGRWGSLRIYQADEAMNNIRVNAYNTGLKSGYVVGYLLPGSAQKAFLSGLRKRAHHPSAGGWTHTDQISFVISLAVEIRRVMR